MLAGLYDCATLEGKDLPTLKSSTSSYIPSLGEAAPLWTFTIVTTEANKDFTWLHDRQPVILSTEAEIHTWLDTTSHAWTKELTTIVRPYNNPKVPLKW